MSVLFLVIRLVIYKGENMVDIRVTNNPLINRVKNPSVPSADPKIEPTKGLVENYISTENLEGAETKTDGQHQQFREEQAGQSKFFRENLSVSKPTKTQDDINIRPSSLKPLEKTHGKKFSADDTKVSYASLAKTSTKVGLTLGGGAGATFDLLKGSADAVASSNLHILEAAAVGGTGGAVLLTCLAVAITAFALRNDKNPKIIDVK